jgi:putative ABC transport system substrate-binding protein
MTNRRSFIAFLGGAAAWPLAVRAQQPRPVRRVGFLVSAFPPDDPELQARNAAFLQGLEALGWSVGRNLRIDYRWGLSDADRLRRSAEELTALAPEVLFAAGGPALIALQQVSRNAPIVFANVSDPVGAGYVESLPRPGRNTTGFMNMEYSQSGKWLELLKQVAPDVTRAAIVRSSIGPGGPSQYAAIQAVAPLFGVEVVPINVRDTVEIERSVTEFARIPRGGLIVTAGVAGAGANQRSAIIDLAARHRLPAVYFARNYVTEGGLISYGPDYVDLYRRSASYIDRVLKGDKPADLPVQAPTKYEMIINLKAAKALGLAIPATVYARATEVIE